MAILEVRMETRLTCFTLSLPSVEAITIPNHTQGKACKLNVILVDSSNSSVLNWSCTNISVVIKHFFLFLRFFSGLFVWLGSWTVTGGKKENIGDQIANLFGHH